MENNSLVSVCLFTYNQEAYIRESLEAALEQTYSPLEIVISDDCSTDRTTDVIREVLEAYTGEHRIILNVNVQNMGIGGHVSKVLMELCSGDHCILVGGDDISKPDHVDRAVHAIKANPEAYAVDFSASVIDGEGRFLSDNAASSESLSYDLSEYLQFDSFRTFAPGRIVRRELFKIFGGITQGCPTEDSVIVLRALMLGSIQRLPINVISYRRTESSVSVPKNLKKLNIQPIIDQYRKDVETAYEKDLIDASKRAKLLRRIAVDSMRRVLINWSYANWVMNYICRILIKLLVSGYRFSLNFKN